MGRAPWVGVPRVTSWVGGSWDSLYLFLHLGCLGLDLRPFWTPWAG
jgi:hypothetical protein